MRAGNGNAVIERERPRESLERLEGVRWSLDFDPAGGWGWLNAADGRLLFRFPVSARTVLSGGREEEPAPPFRCRRDGNGRLIATAAGQAWREHRFELEGHGQFLLVRYQATARESVRVERTLLLSREQRGLELGNILEGFSPAPLHGTSGEQALLSMTPRIATGRSYFTPPPALVGAHLPAGWVGIGLAELPDALETGLTGSWEVEADRPAGHIETPAGEMYSPPPLVFVFGDDPWELIERYRGALVELGQADSTPVEHRSLPGWWKAPFYCTYGDQIVEMQPHWCTDRDWAHPAYTSDWVREKVAALERRLGWSGFTVIIDAFWTDPWNADPVPSRRFEDLPDLIGWLHGRGHRVLLWYAPFITALTGGRGRLAREFGVLEPGVRDDAEEAAIDATAPNFQAYAAEVCRVMFGSQGLDADGVKMDFLFRLRDPAHALYHRPGQGMGMREARLWLQIFCDEARKVKPDVHINWSAADPRFDGLFGSNRTHDIHCDPLEIERRARICALGCPGTPVNMDGCLMRAGWVERAYLAGALYGIPTLYYSHTFHGGDPVTDETMAILSALLQVAAEKPWGRPRFLDYGRWQLESGGRIAGETVDGCALILFCPSGEGRIFSLESRRRRLPLHGRSLESIDPRPSALMVRDGHIEADWVRGTLYRLRVKEGT